MGAAYHAVFSIVVPIVIVDLIFPRLRTQPYLRTSGLIAWAIALVLGVGVIRVSLIWMDPRHVDSAIHLVVVGALAAALVAWGLLMPPTIRRDRPIPRPRSLVVLGAVSVAGYFALLMQLPGAEHSAYLPDRLAWLATVFALALLVTGAALCRRWSISTRWSPVHSAALVAGALPHIRYSASSSSRSGPWIGSRWQPSWPQRSWPVFGWSARPAVAHRWPDGAAGSQPQRVRRIWASHESNGTQRLINASAKGPSVGAAIGGLAAGRLSKAIPTASAQYSSSVAALAAVPHPTAL